MNQFRLNYDYDHGNNDQANGLEQLNQGQCNNSLHQQG